jgi:hypothetical protein
MLELWERVEKEWVKIPASVCLIESMPRRVETMLKAKGGYAFQPLKKKPPLQNCSNKTPLKKMIF